jgi:hypothetical protein
MIYLKVFLSVLVGVLFGGKLEEFANKYLAPKDDFMVKLTKYGSPAAVGVGTFWALNAFLGGGGGGK